MKKAIVALTALFLSLNAAAQESRSTYNFLRLPVSAHAAALGGDNITIVDDDQTLIFSNPALLSSVSDKTITLSYMNYMSGANMAGAAFSRVVKEKASWAASAQYMGYGKMKQTSADGTQLGDFSAKDIAVAGYFSYMLSEKIVGGVTAKFITSYIGSYNSIGMCVDLGLNYYDPQHEWSVSLVGKNLGGQLKAYDDDYDPMPIDIQLGVSKRFAHTPFRLSATLVDLNHWNYKFTNHIVVGVDAIISESIWIGAGYNFRRASEMNIDDTDGGSNHWAGFSVGAGLNLQRFKLNVAYGKYHVSSSSLMLNVGYSL